jgi:hypothetical protein
LVNRLKQSERAASSISEEASITALNCMAFLASDGERLQRFCGLSGMLENDLMANLPVLEFQGFVLDYILGDETLLLEFAAAEQLKPEKIVALRRKLPGFAE